MASRNSESKVSSKVPPSAASHRRLQSTESRLGCRKGAHASSSEFPIDRVCRPQRCECAAPSAPHVHDCSVLFRFPGAALRGQALHCRGVMKGGECAPGGVGRSGAGRRPGDRSLESVSPSGSRFAQALQQHQVHPGLPGRATPTHLASLDPQDFRDVGKCSATPSTAKATTHQT